VAQTVPGYGSSLNIAPIVGIQSPVVLDMQASGWPQRVNWRVSLMEDGISLTVPLMESLEVVFNGPIIVR
jgi:hypothetical protein